MCMGFVQNFGGLVACRIILGIFEAGVLPAIIYLTSMYYPRFELQVRLTLMFLSTSVAGAFGGVCCAASGPHGMLNSHHVLASRIRN